MLSFIVLGSAAGGGVPQWNCNCPICKEIRPVPSMHNGQVGLAVSADDGKNWFLINASPDLRQQLLAQPQFFPRDQESRHSPVSGVFLTNGEVDAIAGLLNLREGHSFAIYAHPRILDTLSSNSIFNVLDHSKVQRRPMEMNQPFEPDLPDGSPSGLSIEAFAVPGKGALYLEGETAGTDTTEGDNIGLTIGTRTSELTAHAVLGCADVTPELADRLRGADVVFFDGTLWRDDEMIAAGLSHKTGQRMGHLSMSGEAGSIAKLANLGIRRRYFVHINNSNPVLLPDSPERREAERAGWAIPKPGEEIML